MEVVAQFLLLLPLLLTAIIAHEYMHGFVAYKLGDPTAKYAGRLTLNPLAHIDVFGMFIFPAILLLASQGRFMFGWAKPVPVNFANLRRPRQGMMLVGLAGPFANLVLAVLAALLLRLPILAANETAFAVIKYFVAINLVLAVFNMLPIPPLDGSRVVTGLLPAKYAYDFLKLEPYGFIILIVLLYLGILGNFIWPVVSFLLKALLGQGA